MRHTIIVFIFFPYLLNAQNSCDKGAIAYENENYKNAITLLKKCVQTNPDLEESVYLLGRSYAQLENWEEATKVYEKLVYKFPDNADYNFLYGGSLGLYAKSLNPLKSVKYLSDIKLYLKNAIELDPKHIDARWALVQIYMELPFIVGGSKSTAEDYANQLLKLSPVDGYLAFGFIASYDEDWSAAEKQYKKAVDIGQSETTFQKLVDVQLEQNKINEAKETLQSAYKVTKKEAFMKQLKELQ